MQAILQGFRPYLLLLVVCAAIFLPGQTSLPAMDRDESRFMQATRQMVESGDYIVVRFQEELRAKKPVGIYWLQAAAVNAFSHPAKTEAWPYRLPSLLAAVATVLMTFLFGSRLFDRRIGLIAALTMAGSLMLTVESHLAKTDATLLALTTLVQGCLGLIYMQSRGGKAAPSWASLAFWLGMGASILVKGPVTPMITALTVITLCIADKRVGWLHGLRPVMGVIITVAMVAPWMSAVSGQTDGQFLGKAVREDLLPKLLGAQESHGAPPGFYLLLISLTLWPASLFLWPALGRSWRERALPGLRFALAWAVPAWLVFELIPTKLPHYTLPMYPALALMIAATLMAVRDGTYDRLAGWPARLWYLLWSLIALAVAGAALWLPVHHGGGFTLWAIPTALAAVVLVAGVWWHVLRRHFLNALVWALAMGGITQVTLVTLVGPRLSDLWVSENVVRMIDEIAPGAAVAAVGYHEPSLVFLTETKTRLTTPAGAAEALITTPNSVAVVNEPELEDFHKAIPAGTRITDHGVVTGLNYSRGKPVRLHLLTRSTP